MSKIKVNELEPISGSIVYVTGTVSASSDLYCAGNTEIAGNLTVKGTTTTIDTTNMVIEDPLLVLAKNVSGTPSSDAGLVIERGSSTNAAIIWDESKDEFSVITTTEAGTTAGNVSIASYADFHAGNLYASGSGKLGVGTTSPSSEIEVEGSSGDLAIEIDNNVANSANFKISVPAGSNRVDLIANALTGNPAALADTTIAMKDQRVGINDTTPSYTLDVNGDGRFTGNLIVSGTLDAHVADFKVTADTMTFGDASGDTVTFNASTVSIPNNLNFDSNTLFLDASNNRIGIGTASPSSVLEIEGSSGDLVFEIDNNASNSANFQIQNGAGNSRVDIVMNDGSTSTTMTMKDQKVGILDTSPSYTLDVNGTLRAVGLATFDAGLSAGDANITNVGDIALDSISSDAGTSINVTLGTDAGDDFIVATNAFVVEGDTKRIGIGTASPTSAAGISKFIEISDASSAGIVLNDTGGRAWNFWSASNKLNFWNATDGNVLTLSTDKFVGINVTDPDSHLEVLGTGTQLKLSYDADSYSTLAVSSASVLTVASAESGDIVLDSAADVVIDAAGGNVEFKDAGTLQLTLDMDGTAGEIIMQLGVDSDDFVFKQYDGTEVFRVEDNGDFDVAGGAGSSGVTITSAGQLTADGRIIVDDATEATSTTDGSLQTDGGLSVAKSAVIGDDLDLLSDGAIVNFGASKEIVLTHVADTGLTLSSAAASTPVFEIKNTHNGGSAGKLKFNNTEGDTDGADGDDLGSIEFWGNDDGTPSAQEYARILAEISDASSGAEGGKLSLMVAEHDGTVTAGLILQDGDADGEIDVTIGAGSSSVTTIAGDLTVNGTTTTVNSTVTTVDDPIITLGGDTAPGSDDNKDRGIEFRWSTMAPLQKLVSLDMMIHSHSLHLFQMPPILQRSLVEQLEMPYLQNFTYMIRAMST